MISEGTIARIRFHAGLCPEAEAGSRSLDEKLLAARGSRLSARPALLQLTRHRRRPSLVLTL